MVAKSQFARNVQAAGPAGQRRLALQLPPSGSLKPLVLFEDSEWLENVAGSAAAVFVSFGQADVRFRRCVFRCVAVTYLCCWPMSI
eukprot:COSAG04_NODE_31750_length_255_cov_0.653846_1_plen_85_part_11